MLSLEGTSGAFKVKPFRNKRKRGSRSLVFPKKPFKMLEIPGFEDNFYHNVIDLSSKGVIAVVLGNSVFTLNIADMKINKIYEAFDCEEISSLNWDKEGKYLAIGNILGEVQIWDIHKKKDIQSFESHS